MHLCHFLSLSFLNYSHCTLLKLHNRFNLLCCWCVRWPYLLLFPSLYLSLVLGMSHSGQSLNSATCKYFSIALSAPSVVVTSSAALVVRFCKVLYLDFLTCNDTDLKYDVQHVAACCTLHNVCKMHMDDDSTDSWDVSCEVDPSVPKCLTSLKTTYVYNVIYTPKFLLILSLDELANLHCMNVTISLKVLVFLPSFC